ncbi:MAG: DNA primase [Clostridia bacterium]|nr:DNA primase [Clostridia bacterium]
MANFYPDELISEIVNANDIVSLVSSYVSLKKSGSGYMGCCPFHREKTPSFHVSGDKQLYHCFGCGAGGSVIQFVMAAENLDFPDALKLLSERAGINLPEMGQSKDEADEFYKRKRRIYDMNRDAARHFREVLLSQEGKTALDYLTNRGLSMKTITSFGLGASPDKWDSLLKKLLSLGYERELIVESGLCIRNEKNHVYDRFRNRVMYPIFDTRGNVVGFGGRKLEGDGAKYINSPESIVYNKSKTLYALNFAKKSQHNYLILTEGYMDVISLHQAGFTSAIAGCGTALTQDQARLAAKHSKNIYLCYDSDEAGQKAAKKAIELFAPLECNVRVLKVPDGKDPDEFIRKRGSVAFEELLSSARATTRYEVDSIMAKYDLDDIAQKVEFSREAAQFLSKLKSAVEQDEYIKYICRKANISESALTTEIKKLRRRTHQSEINSQMRRSSGVQTAPTAHKKSEARLKKAECGLLCILLSERNVFEKLKDKVTEDLFTHELHREIFQKALELFNQGSAFGITELSRAFTGREGEFSEVFLQKVEIADPKSAAVDFIKVIEEETLNIKIAQATAAGDVNLLSELLKQQKSLKG